MQATWMTIGNIATEKPFIEYCIPTWVLHPPGDKHTVERNTGQECMPYPTPLAYTANHLS